MLDAFISDGFVRLLRKGNKNAAFRAMSLLFATKMSENTHPGMESHRHRGEAGDSVVRGGCDAGGSL